jgi:hypothetical protein
MVAGQIFLTSILRQQYLCQDYDGSLQLCFWSQGSAFLLRCPRHSVFTTCLANLFNHAIRKVRQAAAPAHHSTEKSWAGAACQPLVPLYMFAKLANWLAVVFIQVPVDLRAVSRECIPMDDPKSE